MAFLANYTVMRVFFSYIEFGMGFQKDMKWGQTDYTRVRSGRDRQTGIPWTIRELEVSLYHVNLSYKSSHTFNDLTQ